MNHPQDPVNQLAEYIIKNISKGYTLDSLKVALESQGYSKILINNAIKKTTEKMSQKAPVMNEKPQITYRVLGPDDVLYEKTYVPEGKKGFWQKLKELFSG